MLNYKFNVFMQNIVFVFTEMTVEVKRDIRSTIFHENTLSWAYKSHEAASQH
jgi:hypothetical protein